MYDVDRPARRKRFKGKYEVVDAGVDDDLFDDNLDPSPERVCSKYPYYTRDLVQGLLLGLCGMCGGLIGYEVMKTGESPAMVFNWILRHFEAAPKYVIYDNACNLARYAFSREPLYFRSTHFVVDRFH